MSYIINQSKAINFVFVFENSMSNIGNGVHLMLFLNVCLLLFDMIFIEMTRFEVIDANGLAVSAPFFAGIEVV